MKIVLNLEYPDNMRLGTLRVMYDGTVYVMLSANYTTLNRKGQSLGNLFGEGNASCVSEACAQAVKDLNEKLRLAY